MTDADPVRQILDFWFSENVEAHWFDPDAGVDRQITERFGDLHDRARAGGLDDWKQQADSALALVILLDQFPRNMFRGSPHAFESDAKARVVSRAALESGFDRLQPPRERAFFYLPLMHSENLADQDECVRLYRELQYEDHLDFAIEHRDIIARFGRFPHRNTVLGRQSSAEELEFLKSHKGF